MLPRHHLRPALKPTFLPLPAMLDNLTQRLARVVKTMRGEARLTEANTAEMLREVRLAMLEADVALPVVREFIARVKEKALGEDVVTSLTPGQALVGVVQRELTAVIGGDEAVADQKSNELNLNVQPPAVILMAGLQGAGKTTTSGKLAKWLKENKKKKVLTVSCDVYRPAAIAQLKTVSEQVGVDFFPSQPDQKPVEIARAALDWARKHYHDVLIVDTAGRLGIDEAMMQEIAALHAELKPAETLFVVDAMLGQDAVNTAKAFNDALPLTGVVLTKLDGDARGGAALSVRHITGRPIKFVGVGEKLDGLEPFYADRMAQRILGMGDILALVEEAQRGVDMEAAEKLAKKIKKTGGFDLEDFKAQIGQMKKMGGLGSLVDKLPAQFAAQAQGANMDQAEKQVRRMEGIINSMTPAERAKPDLIKASRKRRIAAGAGVPVQEVNRLLNQFDQMQGMMKKLKGGGMMKMMRQMGAMKGGMKGLFNR
ncbi:signal recognition particle subunit SRP54 [Cupriavidus metallidurans]|jgi:signal recognition particle subunit SRP54